MTINESLQSTGKSAYINNRSNQYQSDSKTTRRTIALSLFWIGLLLAVAFAGFGTRSLMQNLRTLTIEENNLTMWADGGPLWITWTFSVTLGSLLAGIGAFTYVKTKAVFSWLTAIGVLGAVMAMVMVWSRYYNATLFGIGGTIILVAFFAIVWVWMKKYAALDMPAKVAGSFKADRLSFLDQRILVPLWRNGQNAPDGVCREVSARPHRDHGFSHFGLAFRADW